jgi:O-antigen/teichoic acid export membrane protein
MHMSLRQRAIHAVAWSTVARVGNQASRFVISVLLARLLAPEHFGLIGMVTVFTGFAAVFAEFGLGAALVQRREVSDEHWSSAFWINVAVGWLVTGLFLLSAPALALFFGIPDLEPVCRALAFTFAIGGIGIVPTAMLQRKLRFRALAYVEILSAVAAGLVACWMALTGYGVWSLVVQSLLGRAGSVLIAFGMAGWYPRLRYSPAAVRDLLGFSLNLLGFNTVNYWARNADNLVIGKLIGSVGLGIYSRAYSLMLLPITQVISVIARVMFPLLASIQEDRARVKQIYLRATRLITLATFPIMAGLFAVADLFVVVLLGVQWTAVGPILRILCVVGMLQTLMNPTGWLYQSQGRTDWLFRWGLGAGAVQILGIAVGAWFGTASSVAWGYLAANALLLFPCVAIPGRLIDLRVHEVLRSISGTAACAFAMMGIVLIGGALVPNSWPLALQLLSLIATGAAAYGALLVVFRPAGYRELLSLRELRGPRGDPDAGAPESVYSAR